jgi:hypothetical protein
MAASEVMPSQILRALGFVDDAGAVRPGKAAAFVASAAGRAEKQEAPPAA